MLCDMKGVNLKYGQSMRPRSRASTRGLPNLFRYMKPPPIRRAALMELSVVHDL
jgi:hypothetical protein